MLRRKVLALIVPLVLALSVTDCVRVTTGNTRDVTGLQQMGASRIRFGRQKKVSVIRQEAIAETAIAVGAQSGLARRYQEIDKILESHARDMDRTFNFESLLLKDNVLPPVLLEGRDTMKQSGDKLLRITDRSYVIKSQARFVPVAPNWRDYIYKKYTSPEQPHITLLPRNSAEKAIWNQYVVIGWKRGISQANRIFGDNLARLKEDYNGMVLYRKLLAQGMVSSPYVSVTEMGVTADDKHMGINDKILRITVTPKFQKDADLWNPGLSSRGIKMSDLHGMRGGVPGKETPADIKITQDIVGYDRD